MATNNVTTITSSRYGLGARGIDYIEKKVGSAAATVGFPVYDSHGNMVMTLSRSGSSWADGLHRSFGVWGSVRWNPSSSSDVKQRYCANLGHVEDDESGLIDMRARFYEPWTGRFLSRDPARDGTNHYVYSGNRPTEFVDATGHAKVSPQLAAILLLFTAKASYGLGFAMCYGAATLIFMVDNLEFIPKQDMTTLFKEYGLPSDLYDLTQALLYLVTQFFGFKNYAKGLTGTIGTLALVDAIMFVIDYYQGVQMAIGEFDPFIDEIQ